MSERANMKIFWWDSGEGKIFWLLERPSGNEECPWIPGSADQSSIYGDWVQLACTRRDESEVGSSPVGIGDTGIEVWLKLLLTAEVREWEDDPDLDVDCTIVKVPDLGDLYRIDGDFDPVSLEFSRDGIRFMDDLLGRED